MTNSGNFNYDANFYIVGNQLGLFENGNEFLPTNGKKQVKIPELTYQRMRRLKRKYNLRYKDIIELSTLLLEENLKNVFASTDDTD